MHENLVRLYGCCVEGGERILVYNFLENNSLAQTLLGKFRFQLDQRLLILLYYSWWVSFRLWYNLNCSVSCLLSGGGCSNIQFSWRTRCNICIGVARGLAFLHEEVRPHIVHRDIKASNILLDKDLTPKISDFGLAKLLPANMTHVSTRVAGTMWVNIIFLSGYLAFFHLFVLAIPVLLIGSSFFCEKTHLYVFLPMYNLFGFKMYKLILSVKNVYLTWHYGLYGYLWSRIVVWVYCIFMHKVWLLEAWWWN